MSEKTKVVFESPPRRVTIYKTLYPRLGHKVDLTEEERELCNKNFKLSILQSILTSANERINATSHLAFAQTKPGDKREKSVFYYKIDHLEYRGTIYKNLRDDDSLEW